MTNFSYLQKTFFLLVIGGLCTLQACGNDDEENNSLRELENGNVLVNGHEAVDLGLSVKWATCNVGAFSPEGYGGYYAWGETKEKSDYTPMTYKYYLGDLDGDGYYYLDYEYANIGSSISDTQYDVARVKWGKSWRIPTRDEIEELLDGCTWKWTTYNGVNGQLITAPSGNSIFLPAAGIREGTYLFDRASRGLYWSATLDEDYIYNVYIFDFDNGINMLGRDYGLPIRPVTE